MTMRLDSRQSRQRSVLDQLSNSTDLRLDVLMNLINDELTMPLRMSADVTPSRNLNIGAIEVQTLDGSNGTGRKRTIQPISNLLPSFTAGYMTFPAATDGSITASGFSFQTPYTLRDGNNASIANGNYVKVMVALNSLGQVVLSFGVQGVSESSATLPSALSGTLALGYVVLQNHISGVIQNVTDANIRQFAGGGGGGGSGASSKQVTQASHGFKVGNVVYLNSSGVYVLAQADTGTKAEAVGMVSSVVTTNIFEVTELGYVSGIDVANVTAPVVANLTVGEVYFLSATDAGKIVVTEPSIIGNISKPMLIADSTNSGYVLNYRGSVVGGTNARTELSLTNVTTAQNIQNFSDYEAGEITGWVYIDATPDLRFYVAAQFSRGGNGNYNLSYQTSGDTPPTGFSVSIQNAGQMQITLSSGGVAGFSSAKLNYALNAPALGASFPLSLDSTNIGIIRAKDSTGLVFQENDGATTGTVSDTGAWTLGPSGFTGTHSFNGKVGVGLASSNYTMSIYNATIPILQLSNSTTGSASGDGFLIYQNGLNSYLSNQEAGSLVFETNNAQSGVVSSAGAWTLGPSSGTTTQTINGLIYGYAVPGASANAHTLRHFSANVTSSASILTVDFGNDTDVDVGAYYVKCTDANTTNGGIASAGAASVSFATSSDSRLKQDAKDFDGLGLVAQMQPKDFEWKDYPGVRAIGFYAQELYECFPQAVVVGGDEIKENGFLERPWSIDYSKLTPVLVKAIQELKAELDATKAELAELKASR